MSTKLIEAGAETTTQPDGAGQVKDKLLIDVQNLNVSFPSTGVHRWRSRRPEHQWVVKNVSLQLRPGECLALVGESGSGKSVTARSLVGLSGRTARLRADELRVLGHDATELREAQWRQLRGAQIGYILQDALVSLDPLRPVGKEIAETLALHGWEDPRQRHERVIELLAQLDVPEPELRARQRSGELSGGLRQRALIAAAVALEPQLVIADEPTTALDATVQAQVVEILTQMKHRGTGTLLISHDFSVVGSLADHVAVMQNGAIVEQGPVEQVLNDPQHAYTRRLLEAIPSGKTKGVYLTQEARERELERSAGQEGEPAAEAPVRVDDGGAGDAQPVITARDLIKSYRGPDGRRRTVVKGVSFELFAGQTLGIVGESGSGKSTTASIVLGLEKPDSGTVQFDGEEWSSLSVAQRRPRRRELTVVYQDPLSSFDPRWAAERILTDALDADEFPTRAARKRRAAELAERVGLSAEHLSKHPLALSGGQRQRLAIARALAPNPRVVVLNEAVSALDVSVQAQVLDLITDLQRNTGVAFLFISHDLGVIHHMSDHILVMKDGRVLEAGDAEEVFTNPQHEYTRELIAASAPGL